MVNFENLDKHLKKLIDEKAFPAATIAVWHHNEPVFSACYGTPDPEAGWPCQIDTRFDVASISKLFAGSAFMALCDQGVFSLDEPIHKSFPEFVGKREIRASANALLKDQPDEVLGEAGYSAAEIEEMRTAKVV
jgi:CubicO group peptidase (beta-lactamase class C family)